MEDFRTRVRFPPPPPVFVKPTLRVGLTSPWQAFLPSEPEGEDCHGEAESEAGLDLGKPFLPSEPEGMTALFSFCYFLVERLGGGMPESSDFHYVYLLVSLTDPSHHYTGITKNLPNRLRSHNSGQVPHTSKFRPWKVETAVAFRSKEKAYA